MSDDFHRQGSVLFAFKLHFPSEGGATVTLTATPATGYELEAYSVKAGETSITVTEGKFTMPASDINIILCDGAQLTINGQIRNSNSQYSLSIYGQEAGTGKHQVLYQYGRRKPFSQSENEAVA